MISTPSLAADPVLAAAGDIACDPGDVDFNGGLGTATRCRMAATAALAASWAPDAVLVLGDLQYEDGALAKYQQSYDASWGQFLAKTFPAPGNHDYGQPGAAGYYAYFGARAGDPAKGWYSYDLGTWHLVALNSNCAAIGGCGAGSPQETWLRADLAAHPGVCTLAYWHHPRFSSGAHGNDPTFDAFWRDLYRVGADVVLVGHDHLYERFHRQTPWAVADVSAPRQFTVGVGGKQLVQPSSVQPNSAVRVSSTLGVLKLTLQTGAYSWAFFGDAGGAALDSGTTACHLPAHPRAADYFTITPCRIADTRGPAGASGSPALASGVVRAFPVAGLCGVPASAVAVTINATAVQPTAGGDLRLYPRSDVVANTSVVSFRAGTTRAGSAVIALGVDGQLAAYPAMPPGTQVNLVLDVTGYFVE